MSRSAPPLTQQAAIAYAATRSSVVFAPRDALVANPTVSSDRSDGRIRSPARSGKSLIQGAGFGLRARPATQVCRVTPYPRSDWPAARRSRPTAPRVRLASGASRGRMYALTPVSSARKRLEQPAFDQNPEVLREAQGDSPVTREHAGLDVRAERLLSEVCRRYKGNRIVGDNGLCV